MRLLSTFRLSPKKIAHAGAVGRALWYALEAQHSAGVRVDPLARQRHMGRLYRQVRGVAW